MKKQKPDDFPQIFTMKFRVLPDPGGPPAVHRVRRWLKNTLRAYGIRNEGFQPEGKPLPPPLPGLDVERSDPPF